MVWNEGWSNVVARPRGQFRDAHQLIHNVLSQIIHCALKLIKGLGKPDFPKQPKQQKEGWVRNNRKMNLINNRNSVARARFNRILQFQRCSVKPEFVWNSIHTQFINNCFLVGYRGRKPTNDSLSTIYLSIILQKSGCVCVEQVTITRVIQW